jgi:hypothetical protein
MQYFENEGENWSCDKWFSYYLLEGDIEQLLQYTTKDLKRKCTVLRIKGYSRYTKKTELLAYMYALYSRPSRVLYGEFLQKLGLL